MGAEQIKTKETEAQNEEAKSGESVIWRFEATSLKENEQENEKERKKKG